MSTNAEDHILTILKDDITILTQTYSATPEISPPISHPTIAAPITRPSIPELAPPPRYMDAGDSVPQRTYSRPVSTHIQHLIDSLTHHRINTLTELCRIERIAASTESQTDALAIQDPITSAWDYYVTSNQLLLQLRGLTQSYPFHGAIITDAHDRVKADPESNRSWNLAWLCLIKIRDDSLVPMYAATEAVKPEMWGSTTPSDENVAQLADCFEQEWSIAVDTMLRHWTFSPTWY